MNDPHKVVELRGVGGRSTWKWGARVTHAILWKVDFLGSLEQKMICYSRFLNKNNSNKDFKKENLRLFPLFFKKWTHSIISFILFYP